MTEPWLEGEQLAATTCATNSRAPPGLRTYSERRRHSKYARGSCVYCTDFLQQNKANACCRAFVDNSSDSTAVVTPHSAPNQSRPSHSQSFHPFFSRCSLQGPKPTQHKPNKRSFTQLHLDAGQVSTTPCAIPSVLCHLQSSHLKGILHAPVSTFSLFICVIVMQAKFACITCSVCGLIYAKGEANDEKVHAAFHASYTQGVKFQASSFHVSICFCHQICPIACLEQQCSAVGIGQQP